MTTPTPGANTWESVLTTVLNIPISNRSDVTGQPWLTVVQGGQGAPGGQLISTVTVNATKTTAATSVQVFLNPAVNTGGAVWDGFVNPPQQALSAPASLPLVPATFQAVQQALASVTTGIGNVSTQLDAIHNNVTTGPLQGNAVTVMGELFSELHGAALNIFNQLSNPSKSDAVGAAGTAATTFLNDINSAFTAWNGLPAHSPLGAVMEALTAVAGADGAIANPQNTAFGDLTTPGAWAAVEQQAKALWLGTLTGGTDGFAGLDLLSTTALAKLVDQFTTTTGIATPVVGPGLTQPGQTPVDGGPNANGGPVGAGGPQDLGGAQNPGGAQDPGGVLATTGGTQGPGGTQVPGQVLATTGGTQGPGGTQVPGQVLTTTGGPQGTGNVPDTVLAATGGGGLPAGTIAPGAVGGPTAVAQPFTSLGTVGGPSGTVPGLIGLPFLPGTSRNAEPGGSRVSAGLNFPSTDGILAGAIGALPINDGEPAGSEKRRAPAAGFSVGGGPDGALLSQSVVPEVAIKPPSITGTVNLQLMSTSAGGGGLPVLPGSPPGAQALAGPPGGPPAESSMLFADGPPSAVGGAMLGGQGAEAGANGPMMLPPGAMGGRGQQDQERKRKAYLPEDDEYWGTEPPLPGPGRDAIDDEAEDESNFESSWLPGLGVAVVDEEEREPDFNGPHRLVGIGAEALGPNGNTETKSDWRMR